MSPPHARAQPPHLGATSRALAYSRAGLGGCDVCIVGYPAQVGMTAADECHLLVRAEAVARVVAVLVGDVSAPHTAFGLVRVPHEAQDFADGQVGVAGLPARIVQIDAVVVAAADIFDAQVEVWSVLADERGDAPPIDDSVSARSDLAG